MVAKTTHGKSFKGLLQYCLNEKKNAEILDLNGLSRQDASGLIKEFKAVCNENLNISKPVWHTSLSFSKDDKINAEQMKNIASELIQKLGFTPENHQFAIIQHKDKDHMHCHIIANRIGFDGQVVSDFYSKSRVVRATKQLELDYKLTRVQDIAKKNQLKEKMANKVDPDKKYIRSIIDNTIGDPELKSLKDLADNLKPKGIDIQILKHAKTGKEYGINYKLGNKTFKGSSLGKNYAFKAITQQLNPIQRLVVKVISKGLHLGI